MKPNSPILLFILFIGFSAFAQIELKNKIIDIGTLIPIENASIYVKNTTIGTISNVDGKFVLMVPENHAKDTLIVSSIGYKSFKIPVQEFDSSMEIFLEDDVAALNEVVLIAETRPKTGNEIVLKALEKLSENMPDSAYIQKGFVRHKERNRKEFKWLIESAITLYDSGYDTIMPEEVKINVDQVRKSYDLRDVDSLLVYTSYLKNKDPRLKIRKQNLRRDSIKTSTLVKAIKWNDTRVNGLENLFQGKLNLLRQSGDPKSLFGEGILENHHFELDTVLVDNDMKIYKIKIDEGFKFVDLNTKGIFNNGYKAQGWIYIYWDNYAIKKIEYELLAASDAQKSRSKTLFDTNVGHKLNISYTEFQDKMYLNYIYYETPKLVNVGDRNSNQEEVTEGERDLRFYYTVQEVLFTEIILDPVTVNEAFNNSSWDPDLFSSKPYNKEFWKNYNTLLESEEDEKLIEDLTHRYSLYKD